MRYGGPFLGHTMQFILFEMHLQILHKKCMYISLLNPNTPIEMARVLNIGFLNDQNLRLV